MATARQLVAAGVSERTVYNRCLEGGPWQLVLPGVVLLFTGPPSRDQLVEAALLLCGPDSMVTGLEAARRHGVRRGTAPPTGRRRSPDEVHVLVPAGRQVRSVGYVHVERTTRPPTQMIRDGVRLAPPARACVDGARRLTSGGAVTELFADAVQRGVCTVRDIVREIDQGSRRGTAIPRRVIAEVGDGVRSAAEAEAKELWARTGLPEPRWNIAVHDERGVLLGIADCWLDDVAMSWEIESTEWHLGPADHERTVTRAALFVAAGVAYIASKPSMIHRQSALVEDTLRRTYAHAKARPRPRVRAITWPPGGSGKPHS
ncbi:MAG: hypothetical protein OJJ54_17965 [Pseudonocardia sp.]|nr:hypothetical protein [Pseudonocardia sp.]